MLSKTTEITEPMYFNFRWFVEGQTTRHQRCSRRVERREPRSHLARGEQREPLVPATLVSMGRGIGRLLWLLNEATAPAVYMFFGDLTRGSRRSPLAIRDRSFRRSINALQRFVSRVRPDPNHSPNQNNLHNLFN